MEVEENKVDLSPDERLTSRQRSVMERIDRRVPIKVIANELGVSETRVNQHIRALKDIYEAASLNELVETYREVEGLGGDSSEEHPYRKPEYSKKQLPEDVDPLDELVRDKLSGPAAGTPVLSLRDEPKSASDAEPQIVPGVLDGENAVLFRFAVIVGLAFGILAAVVLSISASMALSDVMDGVATVPVEN